MNDLVEEDEPFGWNVSRVHGSSGWITSGLLRDCLRWSEIYMSQVSIWSNFVCWSNMLAQYKIEWNWASREQSQTCWCPVASFIYYSYILSWLCACYSRRLVGSSPNREIYFDSLTQTFRWRELDLVKAVSHDVLIRRQYVFKLNGKTQVAGWSFGTKAAACSRNEDAKLKLLRCSSLLLLWHGYALGCFCGLRMCCSFITYYSEYLYFQ